MEDLFFLFFWFAPAPGSKVDIPSPYVIGSCSRLNIRNVYDIYPDPEKQRGRLVYDHDQLKALADQFTKVRDSFALRVSPRKVVKVPHLRSLRFGRWGPDPLAAQRGVFFRH
jgi:hypothetical protein